MKENFTTFKFLSILTLFSFAFSVSLTAQTAIGGITPDPSAMLDVQSTSKGLLMPRVTTTQRNSIVSPATGLMVFNTTTVCLEINLGSAASPTWARIKCLAGTIGTLGADNSRLTGSVLMPSVSVSMNSARVPYTGGNGGFHEGQTVNSTGVTGLTATVAAGNFAVGGDSLTYDISGTPTGSGLALFALNIGGQMSTLKVPVGCGAYVAANTWKVFDCYNLGAANTSVDPFIPRWEINGDYWQWGNLIKSADGPVGPGTGNSQTNEDTPSGWVNASAPNDSWLDASKTGNDPCPPGFRVPTKDQWNGVLIHNLVSNAPGSTWVNNPTNYTSGKKFGSNLMLPAAGLRLPAGNLIIRGEYGFYWSSTQDNVTAGYSWSLDFKNDNAYTTSRTRPDGSSVRCIAIAP